MFVFVCFKSGRGLFFSVFFFVPVPWPWPHCLQWSFCICDSVVELCRVLELNCLGCGRLLQLYGLRCRLLVVHRGDTPPGLFSKLLVFLLTSLWVAALFLYCLPMRRVDVVHICCILLRVRDTQCKVSVPSLVFGYYCQVRFTWPRLFWAFA